MARSAKTIGGLLRQDKRGGVRVQSDSAEGVRISFTATPTGDKLVIEYNTGPIADFGFRNREIIGFGPGEPLELTLEEMGLPSDATEVVMAVRENGTEKWNPTVTIDLSSLNPPVDPVPPFAFSGLPVLTLTANQVGAGIDYAPPGLTGTYSGAVNVLQSRVGVGAWVDEAVFYTTVQADMAGKTLRAGTRVFDENGVLQALYTTTFPFIEEPAGPADLTPPEIPVGFATWNAAESVAITGQAAWTRGNIVLDFGLFTFPAGVTPTNLQWSTSLNPFPPDTQWETLVSRAGGYDPRMTADASNVTPYNGASPQVDLSLSPRVDYSTHKANDATRAQFRVRFSLTDGANTGAYTNPSPTMDQMPMAAVTPPTTTLRAARPFYHRPSDFNQQPANRPDLYPYGKYGGEGLQNNHVFDQFGEFTLVGGDMCGLRYSPDAGATWIEVEANGLRGCVFSGIGVDRGDPSRWIIAASSNGFLSDGISNSGNSIGLLGKIYLSTNYGKDCTIATSATLNQHGRANEWLQSICQLADWTSHNSPTTRSWRHFEWGGGTSRGWKSDAGGGVGTWTSFALPSALSSAKIYRAIAHPTNKDVHWLCTTAGLWKTTNDGGSYTRLGNGTGKLNNEVRSLWVDPTNPSVMLATVFFDSPLGVFYTSNGGSAAGDWTAITPATGGTGAQASSPTVLNVGPTWADGGVTRRTIYLMNNTDSSHKKPWIQHWNVAGAPSASRYNNGTSNNVNSLLSGQSAPKGTWFLPRVNVINGANAHYAGLSGQSETATFAPHPTDRLLVACFGYGVPWYSDNGGSDWYMSDGYGGMNSQGIHFEPTYPKRFAWAMNDIGMIEGDFDNTLASPSVCRFAEFNNPLQPSLFNEIRAQVGNTIGGTSVAIIPNLPAVPSGRRGGIIVAVGDYGQSQGALWRVPSSTRWTWWADLAGNRITQNRSLQRMYFDRFNPLRVYMGDCVSTDAGIRWNVGGLNRYITGVSYNTAGVIWGALNNGEVSKSTNYGSSWSSWATGLDLGGARKFCWHSPASDLRAIARAASGDLILIREGQSNVPLNLIGQYSGIDLPFLVSSVTWCPRNNRRITAYVKRFGGPQLWEGFFASDFSSITWTNIDRNQGKAANTRDMGVHPVTGERFFSSGCGVKVLPVDGETLHATSWWTALPQAILPIGTSF